MESANASRLPSVIASKPFYISPGYKLSPFRYRSVKPEDITIGAPDKKVLANEKNMAKLEELRWHIENTISKTKVTRTQQLQKRREEDQAQLQRKRQWVREQRFRHREILRHMKEYLHAAKKYYWSRFACDCGCSNPPHRGKHQDSGNEKIKQHRDTKLRLNNISLSATSLINRRQYRPSLLRHDISALKQKSSSTSIYRILNRELKQLSRRYFFQLKNLQKQVKTHLTSTKGISRLLRELVSLKPSDGNSVLRVLSLTKNHWQSIFKSVLGIKKLERKFVKVANENNHQIEYNEIEKVRKEMLDDMYNELCENRQYFNHIQNTFQKQELEEAVKEELEFQDEESYRHVTLEHIQLLEDDQKENKQHISLLKAPDNQQKKMAVKTLGTQYSTDNHGCVVGHKAEIHDVMEDVVMDFMKHQELITPRKKPPKKSLLNTLGVGHLVNVQGQETKKSIHASRNSLYNNESLNESKAASKRSSIFLGFQRTSQRQSKNMMRDSKRSTVTKVPKPKKKKKIDTELKEESFPQIKINGPEQINEEEQAHKNRPKLRASNLLKGMFEEFKRPQQESTLNNFERESIYSEQNQTLFCKLKSLKLKKKLQSIPKIETKNCLLQKIDRHQNRGIIKTRLFQLFKQDHHKRFHKEASEFLGAEDHMDQNIELEEKLVNLVHQRDDFGWIDQLDFKILGVDVDVIDLLLTEKIKSPPMTKKVSMCQDASIEFLKQKTMTAFELQCQKTRLKAFHRENAYMSHRRNNNSNLLEQNS